MLSCYKCHSESMTSSSSFLKGRKTAGWSQEDHKYQMCFRKDYSAEYKLVLRLIDESVEVPEMASQPNLS